MGFSPLAKMSRRIPDIYSTAIRNRPRSSPRESRITGFTIHHHSGVDAMGEATRVGREVSANYWIANDGTIIPHVDENRRAWTSGHPSYPAGAASDYRNVTVEVSNSPEGIRNKTYAISPAAMRSLIALIGDVFKRHNLGPVRRGKNSGVAVHQDFMPTVCPGPYIMSNLTYIIAEAEKARTGKGGSGSKPGTSKPAPVPVPSKPSGGSREWPGSPLLVDGGFGPITRRAYQRLLAWDVTGKYAGRIDGDFGPMTVRAEQAWLKKLGHYKGRIDGQRGPLTRKALQSFLYDKGLYRNGRYSKKALVDGVHGTRTIKALQAYINNQRKYA